MRKFSHAPHWMAAAVLVAAGCSTAPKSLDPAAANARENVRREQLLAVAAKYDAQGRRDAANRIYQHLGSEAGQHGGLMDADALLAAVEAQSVQAPASQPASNHESIAQSAHLNRNPASARDAMLAEVQRQNRELQARLQAEIRAKQEQQVHDSAVAALTKAPAPAPAPAAPPVITPAAAPQPVVTPVAAANVEHEPFQGLAHADLNSAGNVPAWASEEFATSPAKPAAPPAEVVAESVQEPKAEPVRPAAVNLVALCDGLPAELEPVVARLSSEQPAVRVEALLELCEMKTGAASAAVAVHTLLSDADPVVSVYAAGTLHAIAGDTWDSVRVLSEQLHHRDERVVRLACYLLGEMGPGAMAATPTLEAVRNMQPGLTSLHAAEALTRIAPDDPVSVVVLRDALFSLDQEERWFATISLGSVEGACASEAAHALLVSLNDHDERIRAAACLSLGGLGQAGKVAIRDLHQLAAKDTSDVRVAAQTALRCLEPQPEDTGA